MPIQQCLNRNGCKIQRGLKPIWVVHVHSDPSGDREVAEAIMQMPQHERPITEALRFASVLEC